jgi:hypothetical protein
VKKAKMEHIREEGQNKRVPSSVLQTTPASNIKNEEAVNGCRLLDLGSLLLCQDRKQQGKK